MWSKLQIHLTKNVPDVSHILTRYDYHFMIPQIGKFKKGVAVNHISMIKNRVHEKHNYLPKQFTSD